MIFLIPARAGSKRLRYKNKLLLCGLPLWRWSAATAIRLAGITDKVMVSTNDLDILCNEESFIHERPGNLCGDQSTTQELIDWLFASTKHDTIILLQPTSPTRPDHLVRMMIARGDQCRSVTNGEPNGQVFVYRRGHEGWVDVETERGWDIDVQSDFDAAEADMLKRFQ